MQPLPTHRALAVNFTDPSIRVIRIIGIRIISFLHILIVVRRVVALLPDNREKENSKTELYSGVVF